MKRLIYCSAVLLSAVIFAPALLADVKTEQKATFKLEGMLGAMLNRAAGGDKGITSTIALVGNRMANIGPTTGQIVDLGEEKVYTLDMKKKEYTVQTFAEMRAQLEQAREEMAKQQAQMNPQERDQAAEAARQLEFDVDVRKTGATRTIAGHEASETVLTITMREKGKTLEEGGGMVMTSDMWLAPRVAELDELTAFNMKFAKAVYGGYFSGMNAQQMGALSGLFAGIGNLYERMGAESQKLQGTPLSTTTVIETVKSAEQMANAPKAGGGGLSGMLARRMMRGQSEQRTKTLTTTSETLSIASAVSPADVALPAGFKEKKK